MDESAVKFNGTRTGLKIQIHRNSINRQVLVDGTSQVNGSPANGHTTIKMDVDQPNNEESKVSQSTNDIAGNSATIPNMNIENEVMDYEYDANDELEPKSEPENDFEQQPKQTNTIVSSPIAMNDLSDVQVETVPSEQMSEAIQNIEESDDENFHLEFDSDEDIQIEKRPEKPRIRLPPFAVRTKRMSKPKEMPKKTEEKRLGIETIVPNICFPFLYGGCVELENCYYPHKFPSTDEIYERIVECGPENAAKLFHVVVARCPSLLNQYFETFVEYFALHLRRFDLAKTIAICERDYNDVNRKKKFQFLVKAFVQSGLSYQMTIRTILIELKDVTVANIALLFDLRIVNGTTLDDLNEVLQSLVLDNEFIFKPALGNYLLSICIRQNNQQLVQMVKNLFKSANLRRIMGVQDFLLRQFHQKFILNRTSNGQRQIGGRPQTNLQQRLGAQPTNGQRLRGKRRQNNNFRGRMNNGQGRNMQNKIPSRLNGST